mmetsp:Transcript_6064/g.11397  ORF Transcript_6064/g.11397 Transcript_6064/m.11397 type:complete len:236 (+) Transcript_6064:3216-3923(+)
MPGPKVGEDRRSHAGVDSQHESDTPRPCRTIQGHERLRGQQLRDDHGAVAPACAEDIGLCQAVRQLRLLTVQHLHLAVGIQRLQLSEAFGSPRLPYTCLCEVEVGPPILVSGGARIPDSDAADVAENQILRSLDTDATTADDQDVDVLHSSQGLTPKGRLCPAEPILLHIRLPCFGFPGAHPIAPCRSRGRGCLSRHHHRLTGCGTRRFAAKHPGGSYGKGCAAGQRRNTLEEAQ